MARRPYSSVDSKHKFNPVLFTAHLHMISWSIYDRYRISARSSNDPVQLCIAAHKTRSIEEFAMKLIRIQNVIFFILLQQQQKDVNANYILEYLLVVKLMLEV